MPGEAEMERAREIAGKLTKAQRTLASGEYDDDFVSHEDAAALERFGIWEALPPDDEDEYWRFDITPLGLAVRAALCLDPTRDEEVQP